MEVTSLGKTIDIPKSPPNLDFSGNVVIFLVEVALSFSTRSTEIASAFKSFVVVRASDPERGEVNWSTESNHAFTSQDLNYLRKLGAGSIVGAAAIKYGSVFFPEITGPNLLEAMTIVSSPVIVAVLLLIRQSLLMQ